MTGIRKDQNNPNDHGVVRGDNIYWIPNFVAKLVENTFILECRTTTYWSWLTTWSNVYNCKFVNCYFYLLNSITDNGI